MIWLSHRQASNELELIVDQVRVVRDSRTCMLSHLDELCEHVIAFGTMPWQLIVRVPLKDVSTSP